MNSDLSIQTLGSLQSIDAATWDGLQHGCSPFQQHAFLLALEESGSVGPNTGWLPTYLIVKFQQQIVGACAAYIKTDSYGEYIFDWAWARSAPRFGVAYYPKLTVAAPFTPASGNRLLLSEVLSERERQDVIRALLGGMTALVREYGLSSAHVLFCSEAEAAQLETLGMARRASFQFHWKNRGYEDFEDFLAALKSRKRKQIRKERSRAQAAMDSLEFVWGKDLTPEDLAALDRFYRTTVQEHGGFDYLRPGFFALVARTMPETMLFARVRVDGKVAAGAVFFETGTALYGRYWGCDLHCDFLHFEVAYYAAIERCIERGLVLFEAGAQGEHKLLRGFEPSLTHSAHLVADRKFDDAIRGFLEEEKHGITARMGELADCGPYRDND